MLKLKTPYRNGTTHIAMSPMEFMQRRHGQRRGGLIFFRRLDAQAESSSTSELTALLVLRSCKGVD